MAENEVVVENETNVDTVVTEEPLVVPAAVFTATLGCNWTRLPDFVTELDARNSKKLVMGLLQKRGIELVPGCIVKGVLYRGEYAVAFSLQQVTGWDQAGRDADYYACAFIKDDLIGKIDFERLLRHDYFNRPVEEPMDKIDCTDMVCGEFSHARCLNLFNAIRQEVFDWGALGMLLPYAKSAASRWLVASVRTDCNATATSYADCEGWSEEVVSQVRNSLTVQDEPANKPQEADVETVVDGDGAVTDSSESAEADSSDVETLDDLRQACARWQTYCEQLKSSVECWEKKASRHEQEKNDLEAKNSDLQKRLEGKEREFINLQKMDEIALQQLNAQKAAIESDARFKVVVVGGLAFLIGICAMAVISFLDKLI